MEPQVLVLGTAQDGGIPHAGCGCPTCLAASCDVALRRRVASIAIVGVTGRVLVVDATPDFVAQVADLALRLDREPPGLDALLLTHAHIGHYLGLAYLGREAMNVRDLPLFCTPRMAEFLRANHPWGWLVSRGQVTLDRLEVGRPFAFDGLSITPFFSPHRAEDTDTIGVEVQGGRRRLVYLPDADRFPDDVLRRIREADVALVDGTFHDPSEIPGRNLAEIPHPFIAESVSLLAGGKGEVFFTHLNHTNRLLAPNLVERPALPPGFELLPESTTFPL